MYDPAWPEADEWGPWELISPKDPFETRKASGMSLFERRCRHCKTELKGIPPEECTDQRCQAMNVIGGYEPTSFREIGPGAYAENTLGFTWRDYIQEDSSGTIWLAGVKKNKDAGVRIIQPYSQ